MLGLVWEHGVLVGCGAKPDSACLLIWFVRGAAAHCILYCLSCPVFTACIYCLYCSASLGIVDEDEPAAKPRKRAKKARGGSDDEDEGGKSSRKGTGFARPLPLSEDLAAACGKPEMSRGELSKWIYTYVDQHSLKVG